MTDQLTHRTCNRCGVSKPTSELVASAKYAGGFMPFCKTCRNAYWRDRFKKNPEARQKHTDAVLRSKMLKSYGMVSSDYERMLKEQDGKCKLCGTAERGRDESRFRYWNIDHDHKTGRVRGLLCHMCNITLGKLENLMDKVGLDAILGYVAPPPTD